MFYKIMKHILTCFKNQKITCISTYNENDLCLPGGIKDVSLEITNRS